ncbi:hypothetical protein WBG99_17765 [Streptomyces sp. TG1A-60]|uniref:hypothetical protein n=1 Tax=Streptomyces sp. TG1A-60 TaxID=3129111 RepID=UPI0030D3308B
MRQGAAEYAAALDETMEILRRRAREGRTDGWYKSLGEELRAKGHNVHYRGPIISHLLGDACRRDSEGTEPMLSAIVVLKATGRPAGQFFEPTNGAPFTERPRTGPGRRSAPASSRATARAEGSPSRGRPALSLLAVTGA